MPKICAFAGPRKAAEVTMQYVRGELFHAAKAAVDDGYTHFISGMADGCDLECAKIIIELKETLPEIILEAAIPCRDRLKTENPMFHEVFHKCDIITYISENYHKDCFKLRNYYMVEAAQRLIAVFNGRYRTGTAQTIRRAKKRNREIILINI